MSSVEELTAAVLAIKEKIDSDIHPLLSAIDNELREILERISVALVSGGMLNATGSEVVGLLGDMPDGAQGLIQDIGARLEEAKERLDAFLARLAS